ncbi:MAG: ROK family protein [Ilumatobacteraceae bacterium]
MSDSIKHKKSEIGFGIDIGGSGMKAAPVDLRTGELVEERLRADTPKPATPEAMAKVVADLVSHFKWKHPIGVAFPAVIRRGVAESAANIDSSWIGTDADALFTKASGQPVHVINDADAAGVARAALRRRRRAQGCRVDADVRDGHRLWPVRRRHARAEHRARPPGARRRRCRVEGGGSRPRSRGPVVGASGRDVPTATSTTSSRWSHPTSIVRRRWCARSAPRSGCRTCRSTPRSPSPRCSTPPASSAPR